MDEFEKQVEQEEQNAQAEQEPSWSQPSGAADAAGTSEVVEKIKELVNKGNITKIVIKKGDNVLVNIPLNVGIVGGIIGVAAAPWAIVAAAVATAGFDCKVELVKDSGEVVDLAGKVVSTVKGVAGGIKDVGAAVADGIKDAMKGDAVEAEPEAPAEAPAEEPEQPAEEPPQE